jgi:flagellar biosynthesis anti-sigma factor FlgM
MVLKINDVRGLAQPLAPGQSASVPSAPSRQTEGGKSEPAARIGLSDAAKSAQAMPTSASADAPDMELVQEIRQRIAQGTFEIDYQQVASNLLGQAVASISAGRR